MIWLAITAWLTFWLGFVTGIAWYGWRDAVRARREAAGDLWRQLHAIDRSDSRRELWGR